MRSANLCSGVMGCAVRVSIARNATGSRGEEPFRVLGEPAGQRGRREQGDAVPEDPAPAEDVAGPAAEQEEPAEGEGVPVDHPGGELPDAPVDPLVGEVGPAMLIKRFLGGGEPITPGYVEQVVDVVLLPVLRAATGQGAR
ncbi:MAG TPA: hypothetical protein VI248_06180 [Kineosporiaceae bacterium]